MEMSTTENLRPWYFLGLNIPLCAYSDGNLGTLTFVDSTDERRLCLLHLGAHRNGMPPAGESNQNILPKCLLATGWKKDKRYDRETIG